MKRIYLALILIIGALGPVQAQYAAFVNSGRITFERKVNTFAAMQIFLKETKQVPEDQLGTFMQKYRSTAPQFWTDSFELYFDNKHSLYQPQNPDIEFSKNFAIPVAYKNKVYSNFETKEAQTIKQAFEKSFFITDSLKNIKWKLTDETREIAGYQCHRANALFFDSIYVVAFYTDEILTKGGPESFNGLPGMILGIAIPHQHITIFAKTVTGVDTAPDKWKLPVQGKNTLVNNKEFNATTAKMLKQFGLTSPWVQFFMDL
ncbi:GLPGLI family protein [Niabella sp. CC-SYL272]|uniref:GLPGLI family protein n=1 Tax=Niabella agricola TaxID=2891571 RepID=UPI001F3228F0|nr:GLPGLI family protein [Niabella agricola]MCF3111323.1 GLPGLI family protein [Niabella agricola]